MEEEEDLDSLIEPSYGDLPMEVSEDKFDYYKSERSGHKQSRFASINFAIEAFMVFTH